MCGVAILLDPARWPAHGTVFGHLVSDVSLDELHTFARAVGLPPQAFDHDHYDVPASRYPDLTSAGATLIGEKELVSRLAASGLRVRTPQRTPSRETALGRARQRWMRLALPVEMRDELLERWGEGRRHYHDVRHLWQCLAALDALGCDDRIVEAAAWFHDAIYEGVPYADEEASAVFAGDLLTGLWPAASVAEVQRLVRMTAYHRPTDERTALLSDADLSILGQVEGRYHVYLRDVRLDYAHVDDAAWSIGRTIVIQQLLQAEPLFHTPTGQALWQEAARRNLSAELSRL